MQISNCAFIWDLDGTLLDSYDEIVSSIRLACDEYGIELDQKWILEYIIKYSGKALLEKISDEKDIPFEELHGTYLRYHHAKADEVTAAPHARQVLKELTEQGCRCFVFTHRGKSTLPVLEKLALSFYFTEIITIEEGFPRKPAPDANLYLIEKYALDPAHTYFVGDRQMDMECARASGVKNILYAPEDRTVIKTGTEDHVIRDFLEISAMLKECEI